MDSLGGRWPRHRCTDPKYRYSVYSKTGNPRLRYIKPDWRRRGWLPIGIVETRRVGRVTFIKALRLDAKTEIEIAVLDTGTLGANTPCFIRGKPGTFNLFELNFPDWRSGELQPTSRTACEGCASEAEVIDRLRGFDGLQP